MVQWLKGRGPEAEFPGGLVVRTWSFHCRGPGSVLGLGTEILHQATAQHGRKKKKMGVLQPDSLSQIPRLLIFSCVTLGKLFWPSEASFLAPHSRDSHVSSFRCHDTCDHVKIE